MKSTIKQEPKTNGQIKDLRIDISEPMKMNHQNVTLNNLTLFLGANGSGKTFCLVNVYALSSIIAVIIDTSIQKILPSPKQIAQYFYDNCFTDQNITGTIGATYTSGATIDVTFDKGKVVDISYNIDGLNAATPTRFMSKNLRTFDAIQQYLKIRKLVMQVNNTAGGPLMEKMLEHYKMYDVTYIEGLLMKMPVFVEQDMKDAFKKFDIEEDIISFAFDNDKNDFYAVIQESDGTTRNKYLTTYGAGHQSMINMMLGNI